MIVDFGDIKIMLPDNATTIGEIHILPNTENYAEDIFQVTLKNGIGLDLGFYGDLENGFVVRAFYRDFNTKMCSDYRTNSLIAAVECLELRAFMFEECEALR